MSRESRLINQITPKVAKIAGNLVLPNLSGDHVRSIKRDAPVDGVDLVNKDYVDSKEVESFPTSLTAGSVVFSDGSNLTQDNANFFWDNANNRLGIGTTTPAKALHVVGQVKVKSTGTSFGQGGFYFEQSADTNRWEILPAYGTLYWGYNGSTEMQLTASGLTVPSGFMTAAVVNGTRLRSGQLQMVTNNLHERTTNGVGTLNLNMIGYGEGTTQFRNTKIGNGKSTQIALFEGSSQKLILEGDLEMTGNSVINADGILSLTSDSYISLDGGVNKHMYFNGDNNFIWRDSGDSYAPRMTLVSSTGNLGIGTTTPAGALDVTSTTHGLIVPRMTTAQVAALTAVNGMIVYDLTLNKFQFYENGAWVSGSGLV